MVDVGSGAGMRLAVRLEELCGVDVRIALRRAETGVSQQFLDRTQVGASAEQVRSEGMPQRVRADAEPRAALGDVPADQPVDAARGQPAAAAVQEQRVVSPAAAPRW